MKKSFIQYFIIFFAFALLVYGGCDGGSKSRTSDSEQGSESSTYYSEQESEINEIPSWPGNEPRYSIDDLEEGIDDTSITGGYDDFGSPGAALGYSMNEIDGMIMIIGMKFTLPAYRVEFTPDSDAIETASLYDWGYYNSVLEDDIITYRLLGYGVTDTIGLRTSLNNDFIGIILEGNFDSNTPDRIYIATGGEITLTRQDGPYDEVEGELEFTEIEIDGESYSIVDGTEKLQYIIYYSWDTSEQPD